MAQKPGTTNNFSFMAPTPDIAILHSTFLALDLGGTNLWASTVHPFDGTLILL